MQIIFLTRCNFGKIELNMDLNIYQDYITRYKCDPMFAGFIVVIHKVPLMKDHSLAFHENIENNI